MTAYIQSRLNTFLAEEDPRFDWLRAAARQHQFLPLYSGWLAVLGIQPDTRFVLYWTEDAGWIEKHRAPFTLELIDNAFQQRFGLAFGARSHPGLALLMPERPEEAITCEQCRGRGHFTAHPQLICACGGAGWLIPDEDRGPSIG